MAKVTLIRAFSNSKATLGMLKVGDGDHNPIFTLENPWRFNLKDSSISPGKYLVKPFTGSRFKNVWQLMDVPGRTYILIHNGNTELETTGCILLGLGSGSMRDEPCVTQSRAAIEYFRSLVGSEEFELEIV